MEEGRLTGTRLPREECMLPRAFSNREILELGRPRPSDGHLQLFRGLAAPEITLTGNDVLEGHFHPVRIDTARSDLLDELDRDPGIRSRIEFQRHGILVALARQEAIALAADPDTVLPQHLRHELGRATHLLVIPVYQRVDPAARSAHRDALEAFHRGLTETCREVCDDKEVIFLGDVAGLLVIVRDGLVLVAEIHLDYLLNVLIEFTEFFLNLPPLGPDPPIDDTVFEIGEVHDSREVFPQTHRVNDREAELPGGSSGQEPEHDVIERTDHGVAAGAICLEED